MHANQVPFRTKFKGRLLNLAV